MVYGTKLKHYIEGSNFENCKCLMIFQFTKYKPCPFGSRLRKFALEFVILFFFKNAENIASGGLILYLEKFGLISYFNF